MASNFAAFLNRNSVQPAAILPLVHTTAAYSIQRIWDADELTPQPCDVFGGPLTYFFVGRPAYRVREGVGEAELWELPCCFIFEYSVVPKPERVFPFDSGAFAGGRMPGYIQMMPLDAFNSGALADAAPRIIGAYFGNIKSYFQGEPKDSALFQREFSLGVFDAEVKAVHRLALEKHNPKIDDRRLTVEIQTADALDLRVTKPLAVVAPLPYFKDRAFRKHVIEKWGARPISYPISSLSVSAYYASIYERIEILYRKLKYL